MDRSDVMNLITAVPVKDEIGQIKTTETKRQVFCHIGSVSASEFFQGGQNGLKPEYKVTMFKYDYSGERSAEVNGIRYEIYRTYEGTNDEIELYMERRTGTS